MNIISIAASANLVYFHLYIEHIYTATPHRYKRYRYNASQDALALLIGARSGSLSLFLISSSSNLQRSTLAVDIYHTIHYTI